jgi:hypothetical protein
MPLPAGIDPNKIEAKTQTIPLPEETKKETVTITPTAA